MKFLDCPKLSLISSNLDDAVFGDRRVQGQTEAYSCKLAGSDKALLKALAESASKENVVSVDVCSLLTLTGFLVFLH